MSELSDLREAISSLANAIGNDGGGGGSGGGSIASGLGAGAGAAAIGGASLKIETNILQGAIDELSGNIGMIFTKCIRDISFIFENIPGRVGVLFEILKDKMYDQFKGLSEYGKYNGLKEEQEKSTKNQDHSYPWFWRCWFGGRLF